MILRVVRSKTSSKQNHPASGGQPAIKAEEMPVCVVEQNRLAARYLLDLLSKGSALHAVTLEELIAQKPAPRVDPVFIVDREGIDLPVSECLRLLRERYPNARVLLLDEAQPVEQAARFLALGVHGFVPFAQIDEKLTLAVERISRGELWFSPDVLEAYARGSIASFKTVSQSAAGQAITQRESQIIELVKRRLSNKEIAEALKIQESTVKFHLSNIFSKLQLNRRSELQDKSQRSEIWGKLIAS